MELYLNNALKKKEPHDLKFLQQIYGPRYKPRKLCHIRCNKCFCNGPSCDCCKIHDFREEEKDYDCGCQDNAIKFTIKEDIQPLKSVDVNIRYNKKTKGIKNNSIIQLPPNYKIYDGLTILVDLSKDLSDSKIHCIGLASPDCISSKMIGITQGYKYIYINKNKLDYEIVFEEPEHIGDLQLLHREKVDIIYLKVNNIYSCVYSDESGWRIG